jgi:hypothetical protein
VITFRMMWISRVGALPRFMVTGRLDHKVPEPHVSFRCSVPRHRSVSRTRARQSHCENAVQGQFLHLQRDFSQWAILRHMSGNSPGISKGYFEKPIGSSNPLRSANKSLILNRKTRSPELCRHFRRLATAVAGVGH